MELPFLPSLPKTQEESLKKLVSPFNPLLKFVEDSFVGDKKREVETTMKVIPEKQRPNTDVAKEFISDVLRSSTRSAAELTLKASGIKQFVPGTGIAPKVEKFLFGEKPIERPETPFQTTLAVLGIIPFGFGKKQVAKEVGEELITKFGKETASRIIKEGGEELVQKAIIKGGEETVQQFFAFQKPPAIKKLVETINKAEPARKETEVLFTAERAKRAIRGEKVLGKETGELAFQKALGTLKGELPKAKFEPIKEALKQPEIDELFEQIKHFPHFDFYEKITTSNALVKLFKGVIPGTEELKKLRDVFGEELITTIRSKRPFSEKLFEGLAELVNIPRALMSSMDMSAPLRQGLILTIHKPKQAIGAFAKMIQVFGSEKIFTATMEQIVSRPTFTIMKNSGLYLADITKKAIGLSSKEESFMSNFAAKIPIIGSLVRASERAYVGFLNKLRADVFDDISKEYIRGGITPETKPEVFKGLAEFINNTTGRGTLPFGLQRVGPVLNGVFFSPRFMASRIQMLNPQWYLKLPPEVRKEAAKSMVKFVATGIGIISLAKLGGAEVEDDPRSSDFGKIRMGNVRWDVWGGFQQWVRFISQITTGKTKSISSGEVRELSQKKFPFETRWDLAVRFFRGKLAPTPAMIVDLIDGQNVIGVSTKFDIDLLKRITPIYVQDVIDAVRELGSIGVISVGVPGFFGVGTQVFRPEELRRGGGLIPNLPLPSLPKLPSLPELPSLSR